MNSWYSYVLAVKQCMASYMIFLALSDHIVSIKTRYTLKQSDKMNYPNRTVT